MYPNLISNLRLLILLKTSKSNKGLTQNILRTSFIKYNTWWTSFNRGCFNYFYSWKKRNQLLKKWTTNRDSGIELAQRPLSTTTGNTVVFLELFCFLTRCPPVHLVRHPFVYAQLVQTRQRLLYHHCYHHMVIFYFSSLILEGVSRWIKECPRSVPKITYNKVLILSWHAITKVRTNFSSYMFNYRFSKIYFLFYYDFWNKFFKSMYYTYTIGIYFILRKSGKRQNSSTVKRVNSIAIING